MGKFVVFGIIAYLIIGFVFLRVTVTSLAKKKREDPNFKAEYPGCTAFFAVFLWPLLPLIYLIIGGVIKDLKKLKQEIEALEDLLKEERSKVAQLEKLINYDPTSEHLFKDDIEESKRKITKWEEDLKKLKAQFEEANFK